MSGAFEMMGGKGDGMGTWSRDLAVLARRQEAGLRGTGRGHMQACSVENNVKEAKTLACNQLLI